MSVEQRIDHLIEAGWGVLDSDFDLIAFHHWRRSAFDCLTALFGPDHVYTRHFAKLVRQGGKTDLLIALGNYYVTGYCSSSIGSTAVRQG